MIRDYVKKNEDKDQMKILAKHMHNNEFFKLFVNKY